MTYQDYEQSVASGKPIELYDIYDESGIHWRLNTSGETKEHGGYSYEPDIQDRSEIEIGSNVERAAVTIKLRRGHSFTNQFVTSVMDTVISLDIYRQHDDETGKFWSGKLVGVSFDEDGIPHCRFEPASSSIGRLGVRRRCQRLCDHVLYRTGCNVQMAAFAVPGDIDAISGNGRNIQSSAFAGKADDWFLAGVIKIGVAYRFILYHSSNVVRIDRAFSDAGVGTSFIAYAGCDLSADACRAKFNNIYNFGGLEHLSVKNPFEGSIEE